MIIYTSGDIFETTAEVITIPTNTTAVMGKGLALEAKNRFPQIETWYKFIRRTMGLDIGELSLYTDSDRRVLLFPTKKHWSTLSKLEYIEAGLFNLIETWEEEQEIEHSVWHVTSFAFPRLGCGLGGLDWQAVKPLMERYLTRAPFDSYIYE